MIKFPDVKPNSMVNYKRILRNLNGGDDPTTLDFLKNKKKTLEIIRSYSQHSQKNMLTLIMSLSKLNGIENKYEKELAEMVSSPIIPKKSHDDNLSWERIQTIRGDLPTGLQRLVLSLYTLTEPRRNKDYQNMIIINKRLPKDKANFLWLDKQKFVFRDYKTDGTYGEQIVDIPDALFAEIKRNIGGSKVKRLLLRKGLEPLQHENDITLILNKALGQQIGSSQLRHIYLRHTFGDDYEQRAKTAYNMAHSVATQGQYIAK
jgi:hypothetical protein